MLDTIIDPTYTTVKALEGRQMDESKERGPEKEPKDEGAGINRRTFLGALGAAVVAGGLGGSGSSKLSGQEPTYWFYDSFGNVVALDQDAIDAGVVPPPLPMGVNPPGTPGPPPPSSSFTYVNGGYPQPNILLIMVDQLRYPRWLTSAQKALFNSTIMPNVYGSSGSSGLAQKSTSFTNYFVTANACTPSRSAILTGLYAQQTCMFVTNNKAPSLQPWNGGTGFPSIGDVLIQSLNTNADGSGPMSTPYDTAWIGKWHVSDFDFTMTGGNGPADYGFTSPYNIPTPAGGNSFSGYPNSAVGYQSPNGAQNEGAGGDTLGNSVSPWVPTFSYNFLATPADPSTLNANGLNIQPFNPPYYQLSDAAIYHAFKEVWLPNHPNTEPASWFLGLSFVNPHDITYFPWAYGLGSLCEVGGNFNCATMPGNSGYLPPPVLGWIDTYDNSESLNFMGLPWTFYNAQGTLATGLPPSDWNNSEDPEAMPYMTGGMPGGKPGLQAYFENTKNETVGSMDSAEGWCTFLNYYYWMQNLTDTLIGNVLLHVATQFGSSTKAPVIIFTSDHGDFGGSHNIHGKGGALYDECYNVPLLVRWRNQVGPLTRSFTCSSVDLMPFIYSAALGNESWRSSSGDIVNYLQGRESIFDVIMNTSSAQRRTVNLPNASGAIVSLPYVLLTTDEYQKATLWDGSTPQPSHAVGFRVVDHLYRGQFSNAAANFYGGGKLGMYTFWENCNTYPKTTDVQKEFYDYYQNNYGELGNDAYQGGVFNSATAGLYLNAYNSIMAGEMYNVYPQIAIGHNTGFTTYINYANSACPGDFPTSPPDAIPPG